MHEYKLSPTPIFLDITGKQQAKSWEIQTSCPSKILNVNEIFD
jgi:hypothetical protein